MRIWQGLESIAEPFAASSLAIGVFDGVHVGHQEIVRRLVADARGHNRSAALLTFDRHPAELIAPDRAPGYLTTHRQREALFASLGIDDLVIARFDARFRDLSPESFLRFVVRGVLGAEAVFVGHDFRFGCEHAGDTAYLLESRSRFGFNVDVLGPVLVNGERASSSRIRELLRSGDLDRALAFLGHAYALAGRVVQGDKLGRKLGFPTANLELAIAQVIPADGIYAVWVHRDKETHPGACSIGIRPTVGGTTRTIETFLIDFDGDLYGKFLEIELVQRIRDERKLESLEALKTQIAADVLQCRDILATRQSALH